MADAYRDLDDCFPLCIRALRIRGAYINVCKCTSCYSEMDLMHYEHDCIPTKQELTKPQEEIRTTHLCCHITEQIILPNLLFMTQPRATIKYLLALDNWRLVFPSKKTFTSFTSTNNSRPPFLDQHMDQRATFYGSFWWRWWEEAPLMFYHDDEVLGRTWKGAARIFILSILSKSNRILPELKSSLIEFYQNKTRVFFKQLTSH